MTKPPAMPELPEPELGYIETDKSNQPAFSARQMRAALQSAQPAAPGVTGAMQTLIETLKADPEYAWAWHCNVAMAAFDEGLSHYAANKAAARFLSWLAQIDTTTRPGFPKAPAQPAAAMSDADVWGLWLRVCAESDNVSTRVMIANFARAILALRPQAVPMTEDQLNVMCTELGKAMRGLRCWGWMDLVRAVEAHHGITAPAGGEVDRG